MRIAMLARNPELYSHKRLIEAAHARGHQMHALDTLLVYMNITPHHLEMRYRGELLPHFDAVVPRIGASITFYGLAVLRQFEMMGVYALNDSVGIGRSRDKLHSLQLLSRKGIHLPATGFAHATRYTEDIIAMVGGAPVVIKLLEGTQGIGVVLGETETAARSIIEAFRGVKVNILVQEFVQEAKGMDIRCLVVGDEVIGAIQRQGKEGDFRSNIHRGGTAAPIEITTEERRTAIRAARVLGLNCAGVDMLRSNHGPVVVEVNSSPGLEAVERATGVDAADKIIEFIEAHAPRQDEA